jgi:hypothetical protein
MPSFWVIEDEDYERRHQFIGRLSVVLRWLRSWPWCWAPTVSFAYSPSLNSVKDVQKLIPGSDIPYFLAITSRNTSPDLSCSPIATGCLTETCGLSGGVITGV